ncbi:MAG: UDP-N-acetylmuramoyl-tripeptide--D-alanyl-D-alanine ligase [Eubacteriales bacterium]|nr:UDP-N-acetylmuramoyl-tripeptide--D-alanyl-D-alanine ligase [Eubacteriales bacterium]
MLWLRILQAAVTAACCTLACLRFLHMLQLESYQLPGYRRYLASHPQAMRGLPLMAGVGCAVGAPVLSFLLTAVARGKAPETIAHIAAMAALALLSVLMEAARRGMKEKKAFAYTKRMKRLIAATAGVCAAAAGLLSATPVPPYLLMALVPWIPMAAAALMQPVEDHINMGFFRDAQVTLAARPDLIKIGITGSFGKTSTKFVLATILSEKYCVLASPASFNTPMGLTRVIREMLEPRHEVFIAEMGARHKGDIKELIELVHPKYGLLTSVGAQHLETFGDMETIARTKYELIEGIEQEQGCAFFVSDDGIVDSLYKKAGCEKALIWREGAKNGCWAKDIKSGPHGSSFTLMLPGREIPVTTALLGSHNIKNICLACACAARLGLNDAQIMRGVSKLKPVEHRLQLLPGAGGIAVIDDAFNANPVGAKEALRVLGSFPGRHIVVTPGFVEEGGMEETMNRELGGQIAQNCDIAILIGKKHARPIAQGAREAGMPEHAIHLVASLEEAQAILGAIGMKGDTVLFENDLPDNYNE